MTTRSAFRMFRVVVVALFVAPAAFAQAPPDGGFSLPLNCTLDRDCWIINLPDAGIGDKALDHQCGFRTYNRHEGTDVAIRDFRAVDEGADVLASAPGLVTAARDGTDEHYLHDDQTRKLTSVRACGNSVILQHDDGWESYYCHMRKGSVAVKLGQRVVRGERLGLVGMSGRTQFPHVHVEFRHRGTNLNPFTGQPVEAGCKAPVRQSLWHPEAKVSYPSFALYAAGFLDHPPTKQRIWSSARSPVSMPRHAPSLVLWASMFGTQRGDVLKLRILDPGGTAVAVREVRMSHVQARAMAFVRRQLTPSGWAEGRWLGEATLERFVDGQTVSRKIVVPLIIR